MDGGTHINTTYRLGYRIGPDSAVINNSMSWPSMSRIYYQFWNQIRSSGCNVDSNGICGT